MSDVFVVYFFFCLWFFWFMSVPSLFLLVWLVGYHFLLKNNFFFKEQILCLVDLMCHSFGVYLAYFLFYFDYLSADLGIILLWFSGTFRCIGSLFTSFLFPFLDAGNDCSELSSQCWLAVSYRFQCVDTFICFKEFLIFSSTSSVIHCSFTSVVFSF